MAEPTPGEMWRRLDSVVKQLEQVTADLRGTYATREYVDLLHRPLAQRVVDLEESDKGKQGFIRQASLVLIGALLSAFTAVALFVANVLVGR